MKRAWYLGITPDQVGERCILVGDPARVDLFAASLDGARLVSQERGLRTATGSFDGVPVTVSAFGMGAPIAVVVLEELAALGARVVLRAGTAMAVPPDLPLGTFVVAHAALRGESTSAGYAPPGYPAAADPSLTAAVRTELTRGADPFRIGILASYDGFYTDLFAAEETRRPAVAARLAELRRLRVLAADMETSALLVAGSLLGVQTGSLCLVTVDAATRARVPDAERLAGERRLVEAALRAVAGLPLAPR